MRSEWISKTVDIAPGHRFLIAEFITKVRNIVHPKKLKTIVNNRKQNYFPSVTQGRRHRSGWSGFHLTTLLSFIKL